MQLRCITNTGAGLPESVLDPAAGITAASQFPLTVGGIYVCHALTMFRGQCWYYIFDDDEQPYPKWRLAPLFEISDHRIPNDWVIGYHRDSTGEVGYPLLSFPEWALDSSFYERLVDREPEAVATFESRRKTAEVTDAD